LRRFPEAVTTLEAALAIADSLGGEQGARSMRWRAGLAAFQARAGDLAGAEASLAKVEPARLADDFDRAEAMLNFSIVRSLQGRHDDALRLLQDAERFLASQGNATMRNSARVGLALAYFRAGRASAELDTIAAAEGLLTRQDGINSPDLADLRLALGRARLDRGEVAGALASLREAERFWMRFDPGGKDAARVQGHLALALAAEGDRIGAVHSAAVARDRLNGSLRVDDLRLLAELSRASL
jgi:tetratricopeptide (TPR) repeat protein